MRERFIHMSIAGERDPARSKALVRKGTVRFLLDEKGDFRPQHIFWEPDKLTRTP